MGCPRIPFDADRHRPIAEGLPAARVARRSFVKAPGRLDVQNPLRRFCLRTSTRRKPRRIIKEWNGLYAR